MLIIFILNIYYSISRLFNCKTSNMYVYHAHNTHCTSICNKILVTHAINGPWGLFMDEYNLRSIHIGG
jgi:hypothetical protein